MPDPDAYNRFVRDCVLIGITLVIFLVLVSVAYGQPCPVQLEVRTGCDDVPVLACQGDINRDGEVDNSDFTALLAQWGRCKGCCPANIAGCDDLVGFSDLTTLLSQWGTRPRPLTPLDSQVSSTKERE